MNKSEIVKQVAAEVGLTHNLTAETFDGIFNAIAKSMKDRDDVRIIGFGTFYASKRRAFDARNPQTGDTIKVKACHLPRFRPGKALKNQVA